MTIIKNLELNYFGRLKTKNSQKMAPGWDIFKDSF